MTLSRCDSGSRCEECSLFKVRCDGCTQSHRAGITPGSNVLECYSECNSCTGFKVQVPGICCRSPLKDVYLTAVAKGSDYNNPEYAYTPRPRLRFDNKAVFYISSGGVNTIAPGSEYLVHPDTEVAAVNLTRVWGANGWFSQDLKDYLHLPAKTKLLLVTMCHDDLLERAWNLSMYEDPVEFQRIGLDFWMPLSFSAYRQDAHMHQYYQALRTLYVTEKSAAWFTTGDHQRQGIHTDDLIIEATKQIPQMCFNTQFLGSDVANLRSVAQMVKHYHAVVPTNVAFWFVGAAVPTFVATMRKQCAARELYFLSSRPLYLASKGRALETYGRDLDSTLPKLELLHANYKVFSDVVSTYG